VASSTTTAATVKPSMSKERKRPVDDERKRPVDDERKRPVDDGGRSEEVVADCGEALHELYTFLDGELTPQRRVAISEHLDRCHDCIEAYDFEAELKIVIAQKCQEQVPDHLRQRIASALDELDA
jgi:mycothiol system anti-sigma-R factor